MKKHRIKRVTLRQQSANALKDFIYVEGKVVGEATFVRPGKYVVSVETPRGNRTGIVRTRSGVRSATERLLKGGAFKSALT